MKWVGLTQGFTALVDDEDYERVSEFKWHAHVYRRSDGSVWNVYAQRHVIVNGQRTTQSLHRFLLNDPEGLQVDHVNGDGLDNRRENIRLCSHAENGRNRKPQSGGSSAFNGVYWHKLACKWVAQINVAGKRYSLGLFQKEEDAAKAYDAAAINLFGAFARTNLKDAHNG